ncbi:MAG TPA: DEAD/DEAH box helicase, partial [Methanotrichaceae archaeon]|nr:DEAD/DEAH box helicase [Methanotrichaceae archaeon]
MKASLALIGVVLFIFPMVALANGQVEYDFGEERALERFEKGMGGPWIVDERNPGWNPFSNTEFPDFRSAFEQEIEDARLGLDDLA